MIIISRKLWCVLAILSLGFFCTIRDDNGNPASANGQGEEDRIDTANLVPSLIATPESTYVLPGDTLVISVRAFADSGSNDTILPLASFRLTARSNRGRIIDDTILTNAIGRARFLFTDTTAGPVQFTVSGRSVEQTIRFEVTETPIKVQKLLQAMPGSAVIKADGIDQTTISVSVLNSFRNPIVGECVQFITSAGTIIGDESECKNSGQSMTDQDGIAQARLRSSNINDTAFVTVYLVSDQSLSDEIEIAFQGMSITVASSANNVKQGDTVILTARVLNASEQPVARSPIFFSFKSGSGSNLSFMEADSQTNYEGYAVARVWALRNGNDLVTVSAAGTKSSVQINVSSLRLAFELDKTILQTSEIDTSLITAIFTDAGGDPLGSRTIKLNRFFKNKDGADTSDVLTGTTNSTGKCLFHIVALPWEGTMRLNGVAYDNSEGYASTDTVLQFITTRVMTIRPPQPIPADGISKGTVMVFIKNKSGNPVIGDFISFTTSAGTITERCETDEDGKAEVHLTSDRRNITATVTATLVSDPSKRQTATVAFKGVELTAAANPPSIRSSGRDTTTVLLTLADAAKIPIIGERFNVSRQQDATFIIPLDTVTDNDGQARCKIRGTGTGQDTLTLSAAGATARVVINYSSNILLIDTARGQSCYADSTDSTRIVVTYLQGDRTTPIPDASVELCATVGSLDTIFAREFTTDENGKINFYLHNPHFAVNTTIFGLARSGSEITTGIFQLYFKAMDVYRIQISGSPEVIPVNGGKAKIEAIAFDNSGNRVKDANLSFNLVNGPSGGEYLDPPMAVTGDDGKAVTYLVSGKTESFFRQVWVTAGSFYSVKSDTAKFTIVGPPKHINIGTNVLKGKNPNDGTFILPCAAVVTDVNGNPVADGTEVTFSLKVSGVVIHRLTSNWTNYFEEGVTYCSGYIDTVLEILPFEDFNDNYRLDPGEERQRDGLPNRGEDINGDGKFISGPGFIDINRDGKRQYNPMLPVEDLYTCFGDLLFSDMDKNDRWDPIEPLIDREYQSLYERLLADSVFWYVLNRREFSPEDSANYRQLRAMDDAYAAEEQANNGFDRDVNGNGIADPNTAVSIIRSVKTKGGKAVNEILYGQSDAMNIEIMIWAESQGVVTETPEQLILPIILDE